MCNDNLFGPGLELWFLPQVVRELFRERAGIGENDGGAVSDDRPTQVFQETAIAQAALAAVRRARSTSQPRSEQAVCLEAVAPQRRDKRPIGQPEIEPRFLPESKLPRGQCESGHARSKTPVVRVKRQGPHLVWWVQARGLRRRSHD